MKVSWEVVLFRFFFFFIFGTSLTFLFAIFSLGKPFWTWTSAWIIKRCWEVVLVFFSVFGTSLTFLLHFFF
ncbi:hypothetical protein C1645_781084, partial [Glomus cerebriforme]